MPDNRNRKRPIQVKFFVDEKEQALIKKKMEHAGIENMSAYIRKMVIDGYVVKLDMPELRELTLRMKSISNSENQIAKRVNSTGNIYEADIEEIKNVEKKIKEYTKLMKEAAANIGGSFGTSISFARSASQQLVMDVTRGVLGGGSQYLATKMREVKVAVKANYQLLLISKKQ